MQKTYVIADIHGYFDQLQIALNRIKIDGGEDAEIVFLGDYIDRGPDSKAVIDLLSEGLATGCNWTCLRGNHDAYMQSFLETGTAVSIVHPDLTWFNPRIGGAETMRSYGVEVGDRAPLDVLEEARANVPHAHQEFLKALPYSHETAALFFAHAGIRPGVAFDQQDPLDLIWIRKEFLEDTRDHGKVVVHGHTAVQIPENHGNRVNLDAAAGYGMPLRPAVFEGTEVWLLNDDGRAHLPAKALSLEKN